MVDALPDDFAEELPKIAAGMEQAARARQAREQARAPKPPGQRPLFGQGRGMAG